MDEPKEVCKVLSFPVLSKPEFVNNTHALTSTSGDWARALSSIVPVIEVVLPGDTIKISLDNQGQLPIMDVLEAMCIHYNGVDPRVSKATLDLISLLVGE